MLQLFPDRFARAAFAAGALAFAAIPAAAADITAEELRGGVHLFQGAGSNVVAVADGADLLVIDGGLAANSGDLLTAIRGATGARRIHTLINTHWHPEQVGLNDQAGRDRATILAHPQTGMYLSHRVTSPLYDGRIAPLPERARPNRHSEAGDLEFAGHRVEYGYLPAAHTNGDLYVFFPELNILAAGGAVGSDSWPMLDYWNGGIVGGLVNAHEMLADLVNDETIVVPAHGPAITGAELKEHRDMYRQLFRDFSYLMNQGMGYDDVPVINPLRDYEDKFGPAAQFLDGAYRSKQMSYVPD